MLTDGVHPSGVRTAYVWPALSGKYARENYWKKWANKPTKCHDSVKAILPQSIVTLIELALSNTAIDRPRLKEFESYLWSYMEEISSRSKDVEGLIEAFEAMYFENLPNGYMQEHLARRKGHKEP